MDKQAVARNTKIAKIETTNDKISGRGGLAFFLRYVEKTKFYALIEHRLGFLIKSRKGLSFYQIVKQLLAFYIDGSDMSMQSFDRRKQDEGYIAILENTEAEMASSHQIKRFFRKFIGIKQHLCRFILHELFIWRLKIEKPEIIKLFSDTMVLDNDGAEKREGVEFTYKKKKGFQPFHITWGPYLVDAIFRSGSKHSNHGHDYIKAVTKIVKLIRKRYKDVPIILRNDSGFMADENFRYFEERLGIHYVCQGKMYNDIKDYVQQADSAQFKTFKNENQSWFYLEFANRLKSWNTFRRCIFTTLETEENGQLLFDFTKTDTLLYTNLGCNKELDQKLIDAGGEKYLQAESIIQTNHQRGKDELLHRSLKEFATKEQLPFDKMAMNRAYYYFLAISHFLYEAYKRDALGDIIAMTSYPTTFRRTCIDFAAKVISSGGQIILKVTTAVYDYLNIDELWERCQAPPLIQFEFA